MSIKKNDNKEITSSIRDENIIYRSFRLPDNVQGDSIVASYEDGVLKLNIPKMNSSQGV